MKNKLLVAIMIITGFIAVTGQGCKKDDDTREYIIKVDSITHADTIAAADGFEVHFYGKIGDNDCFEFSRFLNGYGLSEINVTVYGLETLRDDCQGGPVMLNGKGAIYFDMTPGDWTIRVLQPEGVTPIESSVFVR